MWPHTLPICALPHTTRQEAIADTFDHIEIFYNRSRRYSTLGYHSLGLVEM